MHIRVVEGQWANLIVCFHLINSIVSIANALKCNMMSVRFLYGSVVGKGLNNV